MLLYFISPHYTKKVMIIIDRNVSTLEPYVIYSTNKRSQNILFENNILSLWKRFSKKAHQIKIVIIHYSRQLCAEVVISEDNC